METTKSSDTPLICASIAGDSAKKALARGREMEGRADVLEIRLDSLPHPEVPSFLQALAVPSFSPTGPTGKAVFSRETRKNAFSPCWRRSIRTLPLWISR